MAIFKKYSVNILEIKLPYCGRGPALPVILGESELGRLSSVMPLENGFNGSAIYTSLYQQKVVDKLNALKNVLADVLSVSPSSEGN